MADVMPDLVVFQGRWYDNSEVHDTNIRWTPWVNIQEWEYIEMVDHIKRGSLYQVRILKQIHIDGFGVDICVQDPYVHINPGM